MDTAFKAIAVSGQAGLTSIQYEAETLTFVAGANVSITTDSATNSLTISSSGGGGGGGGTGTQVFIGGTSAVLTGPFYTGDRWIDTDNGKLYTYTVTGLSSSWVEYR
jgi:hypothetical protein